jgi:multidrug efflux pump subunit AcrB
LVRFALRFPHTFYVLAALIVFLGVIAVRTMPADIFPEINIPVVTVIWSYTGLSTPEMEQRVTTYSQYSISANVNGIKNMEAQTLNGLSVTKIYFQPDVSLDLAISQIVAATNAIRALLPAGIQPPIVVQFNASSVPVLQLSLSSDSLSEQQLYDYGIYRVRQQLAPIPGVTLPTPAGGKYLQIMVDIDPAKLLARGLTPLDVVNAVNAQNLTLPSGTAKIGDTQYAVLKSFQACRHRDGAIQPSLERAMAARSELEPQGGRWSSLAQRDVAARSAHLFWNLGRSFPTLFTIIGPRSPSAFASCRWRLNNTSSGSPIASAARARRARPPPTPTRQPRLELRRDSGKTAKNLPYEIPIPRSRIASRILMRQLAPIGVSINELPSIAV